MESYIIRLAISHEHDMVTPSLEIHRNYEHVRTYVLAERPCDGHTLRLLIDLATEAGHGYQTTLL